MWFHCLGLKHCAVLHDVEGGRKLYGLLSNKGQQVTQDEHEDTERQMRLSSPAVLGQVCLTVTEELPRDRLVPFFRMFLLLFLDLHL